jgi:hypothetical protein
MIKSISLFVLMPVVCFAKIQVAVLDSGISSKHMHNKKICKTKNFTNEKLWENSEHGTNVVGLIIENTPKKIDYCINIYKGFSKKSKDGNFKSYMNALAEIAKDKPDILNISAGGNVIWAKEYQLLKKLLDSGTIIVVAAGNESFDLNKKCNYYPACLDKRIVVVGNGLAGVYHKSSNKGKIVDVTLNGEDQTGFGVTLSGTSQSTAKATAFILTRKAK